MDLDAARKAAGLKPLPHTKPTEPTPEPGHGRGSTDDRRLKDKSLRGVPLVGAGPGVIDGTRPGDRVDRLEEAERHLAASRELHAAVMRKARANLKRVESETT